jgi:4-aminobutyrate aminotransferase
VNEIMMRSWRRGVNVISCGASTIRIAPPLVITRELVDAALDIIEDSIKEVERET